MPANPLPHAAEFEDFSTLFLNAAGRFVDPGEDVDDITGGREYTAPELPTYLEQRVVLPAGVTDVFVWVHGWRNDQVGAVQSARRLFAGVLQLHKQRQSSYLKLAPFVPAFLMVRWPSRSSAMPRGYSRIRDRATALTDDGEAEFFLASLLGYLDQKNVRDGSKTLATKGGFYVHCVGHSFGGRFLTAAIRAAGNPRPKTLSLLNEVSPQDRKVLASTPTVNGFEFTVDSLLVFQMAAPRRAFAPRLADLVGAGPLRGPVVLTYSAYDRANCAWHRVTEGGQSGIGCSGAGGLPPGIIASIRLRDPSSAYTAADFWGNVVNVNATGTFCHGRLSAEGAHSDIFYEESIHLLLSLVNFVRI